MCNYNIYREPLELLKKMKFHSSSEVRLSAIWTCHQRIAQGKKKKKKRREQNKNVKLDRQLVYYCDVIFNSMSQRNANLRVKLCCFLARVCVFSFLPKFEI